MKESARKITVPKPGQRSQPGLAGVLHALSGGAGRRPQDSGSLTGPEKSIDQSLYSSRARLSGEIPGPALPSVDTQSAHCRNTRFQSFLESQQPLASLAECHSSSRPHTLAGDAWRPLDSVGWLGKGAVGSQLYRGPGGRCPHSLISWGPLSVPSLVNLPPCPPKWWRALGLCLQPSLGDPAHLDHWTTHSPAWPSPGSVGAPRLLLDTEPPEIQQVPQPTWTNRPLTSPSSPPCHSCRGSGTFRGCLGLRRWLEPLPLAAQGQPSTSAIKPHKQAQHPLCSQL